MLHRGLSSSDGQEAAERLRVRAGGARHSLSVCVRDG